MKSILAFRRIFASAVVLLAFLALSAPQALATHLRGGTISWKVISTTSSTYTVQFTLTEAQRWDYPNTAGDCSGVCLPVGTSEGLEEYTGTGEFSFGDKTTGDPTGTITSINQAEDYATASFTFTHTYNNSATPYTAFFFATNRLSTLKLGANEPEYISTTVQNYANGSPVAAVPAILAVPLQSNVTFNLASAVTDIDPNATLVFSLSSVAELVGPSDLSGLTSIPCPSGISYEANGSPSAQPPGFSISTTGEVTWNTSLIAAAVSGGNCGFKTPAAGDLWPVQITVEAVNKTTGAEITQIPIDLLMEFVSPVGALPTVTLSPSGTQTIEVGSPVTFTATGSSTNEGTTVTLNASGVPAGATATGLNSAVTSPAVSTFSWTPTSAQTGTYVVSYTVTDSNLQQDTASKTIVVANLPTVTCGAPISVPYGQPGTLSTTLSDPSNYVLNVVWTVDGISVQTNSGVVAYPNPATVSLSQTFGAVGSHTVVATATEPSGVAVSCTTSATVTPASVAITLGNLTQTYSAAPEAPTVVTAPSGLPVVSSYTGINGTVYGPTAAAPTNPGSYSVAVSVAAPNYIGQQSGTLTINQADPALSLTLMPGMPSTTPYGTTVYFTLGMASAPQCPTGSVQFFVDGTASGAAVSLSGTSCSQPVPFQIATLTPGPHSVYAVYSGDNYFTGETSAPFAYTVTEDATSVTLAASANTVDVGQPLTLTATLTPASPGNALPPAGTVVFYDGTTPIGTGSALSGTPPYTSTLTVPTLAAGSHSLTATFVDTDGNYVGSSSALDSETVNLNVPTINWTPNPIEYVYGTALGSTQLNATAVDANNNPVAGTFAYSFAAGTVLPVGTVNLTATFTPSDPSTYATNSATITLTVNPAPLTVTADSLSRVYGQNNPTLTYQVAGFVNSDASSVVAGQASCTTTATTASPVTTYPITCTLGTLAATNYSFQFVSGTLTITQATPSLTWAAPAPLTYGTALSGAQLDATANVGGTFAYTPATGVLTAGSQTLSVLFTPTDTTDYTTATASVNLTVSQATPSITWATPASIAYGTALSGTQLDATANVGGTFAYTPASGVLTAGSHPLSVTFTPTDTTDYTTATATVTQVVTQVTPTIAWSNPAAVSYGTPLSAAQLNATASVAGTFSYNPASGTVLGAGSHTLSVTFTPTDSTDYTTATATVTLPVASISLTITAGSPTDIYGTVPTIMPGYSGFIAGDGPSSLTTPPTCTTTATSASNVGSYATSCSGAVDANYVIGYKPGTLTVTPAALTVAANPLSFAYGGGDGDNDKDDAANPMTYTVTGFALGQTAATDFTGVPSETSNTPEGGPVGNYTITLAPGTLKLKSPYNADYTISYASAPLVITPAVLTITATSQTDVYGAVDPDNHGNPDQRLTYTVTGLAYNQNQFQVLHGDPTETTTAVPKSGVGTYPITITQGNMVLNRQYASDYTLVFVNGTITVTPAQLYVMANSYSRKIDQSNPAFSYTVFGLVNGDTQSGALTGAPACCTTTATAGSPAGDYAIVIAPGSLAANNGNYTINFVNGMLIVYNPLDRNDPHCDGFGNYRANPQWDAGHWPDPLSYKYYWGNGGGGPNPVLLP